MFTRKFWRDALERSLSTAAQAAILAAGGDLATAGQLDIFAIDPKHVAGFALGGFALSILKAIAASKVGSSESASLLGYDGKHRA